MLSQLKRKVLKVGKRWAKGVLLSWYFPWIYRKAASRPIVKGKVIFLDNKETSLPDSYQLLWDRLSNVSELSLSFLSLQETRVRFLLYFQNCVAFIEEAARSEYIFLNDASNVVSCLPLRNETTVVQLWHGCGAFKKWGMSTADLKFGGTREELLKHPYYKNLSMVTVSSPEVMWAYEEAMVLEDERGVVQPIGVSRTDTFFDSRFLAQSRCHIRKVIPAARDKKVILYAPTFRGRVASAQAPDRLDIAKMRDSLGDDYVLLIKHHPFVKEPPAIDADCADFAFDVSKRLPINELIACADICLSDYSSLVFEYSLFERPMVFFAYDKSDYDDWRGFYYDYEELTPGPVFTTTDEIIDYIQHIDERFDESVVKEFRDKFMSACDGNATDRIIEAVFGERILQESLPRIETAGNPLVSVIVPVYNAALRLPECLDSIICQTLEKIEIICVDDGSTDDSLSILEKYAASDRRVKVLTQTNQFAGVARNRGIEIAQGKYLVFWDADDFFDLDALEVLYEQCEKDQADICVCGARQYFCDTGITMHGSMYVVKKWIPCIPFNRATNEAGILNFTTVAPWNKMFLREFVEREHLTFDDCRSSNDTKFVTCALCSAQAITIVQRDLVTYRRNQGSALTNKLGDTARNVIDAWIGTKKELVNHQIFPAVSFSNRASTNILYALRNMEHFDGYMVVARYLKNEGMESVGICLDNLRAPWQERFFRTLMEKGAEESLMTLMHETYQQALDYKSKNDHLRKRLSVSREKKGPCV